MVLRVLLSGWKNLDRLNYRVKVNESYDYETSNHTSRLSAVDRSITARRQQQSQPAYVALARHRFKGRDLNHPQLKAVRNGEQECNEEKEDTRPLPLNSAMKDDKKYLYGPHHSLQRNHHVHHHTSEDAQQHYQEKLRSSKDQSAAKRKERFCDQIGRRTADRDSVSPGPIMSHITKYTLKRSSQAVCHSLVRHHAIKGSLKHRLPKRIWRRAVTLETRGHFSCGRA